MKAKSSLLFVVGAAVGALAIIGSSYTMDYTNRTEFCISCHEMEQTVYQEYRKSAHFKNASGVTAGCADCHVPREWGAKLIRKIEAAREIYHTLLGTISTPEKFEAKRLELAERVWAQMERDDSQACRHCHDQQRMDFHKQSRRSREKMEPALKKGKTCIACHKGIVHTNPDDEDD